MGNQDSHKACGQRIYYGKNGGAFGRKIFLTKGLEGKAKTTAENGKHKNKNPLCLAGWHCKVICD